MADDVGLEVGHPTSLWLAMGHAQGTLKAHAERMDYLDRGIVDLRSEINSRFDKQQVHLDSQDQKLDLIVSNQTRGEGAKGVWRLLRNTTFQVFLAALSGGMFAEIGIKFLSK